MIDDTEQLISEVLEDWKHTQLNIYSDAGRKLLAKAIAEKLKRNGELSRYQHKKQQDRSH